MFNTDAKLFFDALCKVTRAQALINEYKSLIYQYNIPNNSNFNNCKKSMELCDVDGLLDKIEETRDSLITLDNEFNSLYLEQIGGHLSNDALGNADKYTVDFAMKENDYLLLTSLKQAEESGNLTEEMKSVLEVQKIKVEQYDLKESMASLDPNSKEYIEKFEQNADLDRKLISAMYSGSEAEEKLKAYNEWYNEALKVNQLNCDVSAKLEELKKLEQNSEKYYKKQNEILRLQINYYNSKKSLTEDEKKTLNFLKDNIELNNYYISGDKDKARTKKTQMFDPVTGKCLATEDEISYENADWLERTWMNTKTTVSTVVTSVGGVGENLIDGAVMLTAGTVGMFNDDVAKWTEDFVSVNWSDDAYDGLVLSGNLNSYSAYSGYHTVTDFVSTTATYAGLSFIPGIGTSASAISKTATIANLTRAVGTSVMVFGAAGSTAQTAFDSGATLKEAVGASWASGSLALVSDLGLDILNDSQKASQFLKSAGRIVIGAGEPALNTLVEYATYGNNNGQSLFEYAKSTGAGTNILMGGTVASLAGGIGDLKKSSAQTKEFLEQLSYHKNNKVSAVCNMLESNIKKFVYVDTNTIDGLNDSLKKNGMYHFSSSDTCDKILNSGYVKSSGIISSYGNKKSFFFNGVPEVGAFATNLDDLPIRATAVKIMPDDDLLNASSLKVRNLDDQAITYDGALTFNKNSATKEYFCLFQENDKLVYKTVTKDFFDSYPDTDAGKKLNSMLTKKNIDIVKNDFYYNMSNKATGAVEAIGEYKSIIDNNANNKLTSKLFDVNATPELNFDLETSNKLFDVNATPELNFDLETSNKLFDSKLTNSNYNLNSVKDVKKLESQISLANYYTSKGNFYTIELDKFDGVSKNLLDQINDPSSVKFKVGDKIYSYLDMKQQIGLVPVATNVNPKTVESQISLANYYTSKGNFYTIELDKFDGVSKNLLDQINDPSSVRFKVGDKIYSYLDMKQQIGLVPVATNVNPKTVESQISLANYYTSKGNFYTIQINDINEINLQQLDQIKNSHNIYINFDGNNYTVSQIKQMLNCESNLKYSLLQTVEGVNEPSFKARKLYMELNKKLNYNMDYVKSGSQTKSKILNEVTSFENLGSKNKVVCKGWSELYADLLKSSGFDESSVRINKEGVHRWVEVDLGNGYIIQADATEAINNSIDLTASKGGYATSGFICLNNQDGSWNGSRPLNIVKTGIYNDIITSNNEWLLNVDRQLGYAGPSGYFVDEITKSNKLFGNSKLANKLFESKIKSQNIKKIFDIEIPQNMDGYEAYAYYKKISNNLFGNDSRTITLSTLYMKTNSGIEPINYMSYYNPDGTSVYQLYSTSLGKKRFNNFYEIKNYMDNLNLLKEGEVYQQ